MKSGKRITCGTAAFDMPSTRLVGMVVVMILTFGIGTTSGRAQGPPSDVHETFTVDGICDFPVLVEIQGKQGIIGLPGDRLLVTAPAETVTLTNLADPTRSETISITGAFHLTFAENGDTTFVVTGRNLLIGLDPDPFVITIGTFTFVTDDAGNQLEPLSGSGRVVNVCQLLN